MREGLVEQAASLWPGRDVGLPRIPLGLGTGPTLGERHKGSACFGTATDPGGPHTED